MADYARFNYVAQPEDNVGEAGLMPRIGDYDDWAIEWVTEDFITIILQKRKKAHLNKMGDGKNYKILDFGLVQKPILMIPRSQSEQVGDNPMIAGKYGVKKSSENYGKFRSVEHKTK